MQCSFYKLTVYSRVGVVAYFTFLIRFQQAYDRKAYDFPPPQGSSDRFLETLRRVWSAGAFAAGLLVVSTQFTTSTAIGFGVSFGDDPATDLILLATTDTLIRDGLTEAAIMTAWRLYRTSMSRFD